MFTEMSKSTVLITGANRGIGRHCAAKLLREGNVHVVLAGRDLLATERAAKELVANHGGKATALELDLGSLASIRGFAAQWPQSVPAQPLRGLICNAGVQNYGPLRRTVDGFEETFGVNHLGHFLLANLMLPYMAEPARIAVVSSGTHNRYRPEGRFTPPRWQPPRELALPQQDSDLPSGIRRYTTSKLANLLFARELARRLQLAGRAITVNAFDPGYVPGTGLTRAWPAWLIRVLTSPMLMRASGIRMSTMEEAGAALAWLITGPSLSAMTGRYYEGFREAEPSPEAQMADRSAELWKVSAELVGLDQD